MRHLLSGLLLSGLGALLALGLAGPAAADQDEVWRALAEGGKVIVMRHASAPGPQQGREGDPSGFRLDDCSTQRNLDSFGRGQAVTLGNWIREHHVSITRVFASPWCRARQTAELMMLGVAIEESEFLANLGEHEGGGGEAVRRMPPLRESLMHVHGMIKNWRGPGNLLIVSHGRMVVKLVYGDNRVSPQQAEMIVLQPLPETPPGRHPFREIGTLPPPD